MRNLLKKFVRRAELSKPLPHSKPLNAFISAFDGVIEPSERKFYRQAKIREDWYNSDMDTMESYRLQMEVVEAVAIHIPVYKLEDFLSTIDDQKYKELEIRLQVPAVKKAYEQYSLLLKMCGGDYNARY